MGRVLIIIDGGGREEPDVLGAGESVGNSKGSGEIRHAACD